MTDLGVVIFNSKWKIESPSPFCLKLLAWLEMAKIPYKTEQPKAAPKSKTGKAPYIILEDGTFIDDSQRCIEFLEKKHSIGMDDFLTPQQNAQSLAFRRLLEDHFYFLLIYQRWVKDFDKVKDAYFGVLPPVVRSIVPVIAKSGVTKSVYLQGTGKRSWSEIVAEAQYNIDALSDFLGEKDFFFTSASSLDAVAFGFLENSTFQ